jgi:hypothetical protein
MTETELAACHVPEDLTSLAPMDGYVVTFVAFYERGFSVLLYRFLCSLLQHYGLELHNLTPFRILHIVATYMGLTPNFDL